MENEIARMRGEEVEADWKTVCSSFGEQAVSTPDFYVLFKEAYAH